VHFTENELEKKMTKSKSSRHWLKEHEDDRWVKRAREEGYRSRASYKLLEIQKSDQLIKPGMTVVDLGAAPGGWSQVASKLVGKKGKVIASDILGMEGIPNVFFIQGDFTEGACLQTILQEIGGETYAGGRPVDLVISDMAPNLSGMAAIDQPRSIHLVELALDFARITLKPGCSLLTKIFQGEGYEALHNQIKKEFSQVLSRKPEASRSRSREVYLLAKGYKPL
jgi:23S rRNA (uridine2552-2'-O)-methyltransferase